MIQRSSVDSGEKGHIAIVGGGFTGLSAAWRLINSGYAVTVLESDPRVGGLAGGFAVGKTVLEKFYHHWFNNDTEVTRLVEELGLGSKLISRQGRTGMFYANSFFRLSRPAELLRFTPLPFIDRIRLGLLVLQARRIRDWRPLENLTAREWLLKLCGSTVYRVVWEPLLKGKFGALADEISAVWLWSKLCLRGGSRDASGNEVLLYFQGGFSALCNTLGSRIENAGGTIRTDSEVRGLTVRDNRAQEVLTSAGPLSCDGVILTPALPICANLLEGHIPQDELERLRRIRYLGNVCLVLRLDRCLSDMYWLNVSDPSFPFVGIIEHTNFESAKTYGGQHIVYLSKYLATSELDYRMGDEEYLTYALPHIQRMFPEFKREWIQQYHVWRAEHSQPVVERHYSKLIPEMQTSLENVYIASMAQVYPEDRGTNYAIRGGRAVADFIIEKERVPA